MYCQLIIFCSIDHLPLVKQVEIHIILQYTLYCAVAIYKIGVKNTAVQLSDLYYILYYESCIANMSILT